MPSVPNVQPEELDALIVLNNRIELSFFECKLAIPDGLRWVQ